MGAGEAGTTPLACDCTKEAGLFGRSTERGLACEAEKRFAGLSGANDGLGTRDWAYWMKAPTRARLAATKAKRRVLLLRFRRSGGFGSAGSKASTAAERVSPAGVLVAAAAVGLMVPRRAWTSGPRGD